MVFFRIQDGKIVEAWEDWDEHGMRRHLGDDPGPSTSGAQNCRRVGVPLSVRD